MKKVDYIIVGLGLAGIAFAEYCARHHKTFMVYDQGGDGASRVAAGLYNPVILKRYSLPWKSIEQFDHAMEFYGDLEKKLDITLKEDMPVRKVFSSVEDQNNWYAAGDGPGLGRFVQTPIVKDETLPIKAPYNYGEVAETGRIDIKNMQMRYIEHLKKIDAYQAESFNHEHINFEENGLSYDNIQAQRIVFAEGYALKKNPFFQKLPLVGNKGEYIIIKAPDLKLKAALKSSFFIVPLGEDLYKVGATFNWENKDSKPSTEAREELITKLSAIIKVPFDMVDQEAGMRPTTGDRRPLVGQHPDYNRLYVLNGLGTRGIMAGPLLAKYLFEFIEEGKPLPAEVNIMRFPKKF